MLCQISQSRYLRGQKVKSIPRPEVFNLPNFYNFVICYRVWCKEAENERSDENLLYWAGADDQFGHMLGPMTYLIILYSKLCGKFPFIVKNVLLYDLTKMFGPLTPDTCLLVQSICIIKLSKIVINVIMWYLWMCFEWKYKVYFIFIIHNVIGLSVKEQNG